MKKEKFSGRNLKREIRLALCSDDIISAMEFITKIPPKRAVNPLFSFLCSLDERLKWRAVTAMGQVVSNLAKTDLESARVIMRRFMWHLNDESGGIGWGCPESMGEIMVRCKRLADEYGCLLISYIQPEGNYLEHEILQRGVLWGVGRLAHSRPRFLKDAVVYLLPYMQSDDAHLRGLAVWAISPLASPEALLRLKLLSDDPSELSLYDDNELRRCTVSQLAKQALSVAERASDR